MCLGVPGRVIDVGTDQHARVEIDGAEREVSLAVLALEERPISPGDWVMVHTGLAVEILDAGEAGELLTLRDEMRAAAHAAGEESQ